MNLNSLDYEFLRHIGVTTETQKRVQAFYLGFFQGCQEVLDLACGDGDFVELLVENGIKALGIDRDPCCCEMANQQGRRVVCADVFKYLEQAEEESVDGIFCAHLVEHLPYERVLHLLELSYRVLKKGGRIVLTTPNVRGLFSHLEMFYLHFGHVTFYHPNLLCFFLKQVGFSAPTMGENPLLDSPLWGSRLKQGPIDGTPQFPRNQGSLLRRVLHSCRLLLGSLLVRPYLEQIIAQVNDKLLPATDALQQIDRSFECWVMATK
jgi:SAM-dependent methyltransferase